MSSFHFGFLAALTGLATFLPSCTLRQSYSVERLTLVLAETLIVGRLGPQSIFQGFDSRDRRDREDQSAVNPWTVACAGSPPAY
jgi:hypothetical protein